MLLNGEDRLSTAYVFGFCRLKNTTLIHWMRGTEAVGGRSWTARCSNSAKNPHSLRFNACTNLRTASTGLCSSRRSRLPEFLENRHTKVAILSPLGIVHLYAPGDSPGTHFCYRLRRPQGHSAAGRVRPKSVKKQNDPTGNRTATFRLVAQCFNGYGRFFLG
jgi:hypothetical protein